MTRDVRMGRMLVASLQQAIAEELPARTEFYDHWLEPERRRDGTLGAAPMTAVLGFLRTEGAGYERVAEHAGRLAGEWTWAATPAWRRSIVTGLPRGFRVRAVLRLLAALVTDACPASRTSATVARGTVTLLVRKSVFCDAREAPPAPLCGFYPAAAAALFAAAGLGLSGHMETCRAQSGGAAAGKDMGCSGTFVVIAPSSRPFR